MWVFATMSEYLLPLQIPTDKYLLRRLVFATVANSEGGYFLLWVALLQ